jgi:hypothetical protein
VRSLAAIDECRLGAVGVAFADVGHTYIARLEPVATRPGDLNDDGTVDVLDLLFLLDAWGECSECTRAACPADFNGDCFVDVLDLLFLLDAWG